MATTDEDIRKSHLPTKEEMFSTKKIEEAIAKCRASFTGDHDWSNGPIEATKEVMGKLFKRTRELGVLEDWLERVKDWESDIDYWGNYEG